MRFQEFLPGGSTPDCQKAALVKFFFFFFFLSPKLILQFYSGLSMVYFEENFPRFQQFPVGRGVQHFPGGGGLFPGGVQHFTGGGGGPTFSRGGGGVVN